MPITDIAITLLVDNQAQKDLVAEHGLAVWIETAGHRILFDTGQGPALTANADQLGISLGRADALVLSHGHYDHTGGLAHALRRNPSVELYCHPGAVQPRYSIRNGKARAVHMPREAMAALDKIPGRRMHWISHSVRISPDIGLTGPIPRESGFEDTGGPFYLDPAGRRKDAVDDDLAMWINTPRGLVVCVGCAHAGLINTLNHIRRLSGVSNIHAVIGGFHLRNADSERIGRTVSALKRLTPDAIVACHCTGENAMTVLEATFDRRFREGDAGTRLHY